MFVFRYFWLSPYFTAAEHFCGKPAGRLVTSTDRSGHQESSSQVCYRRTARTSDYELIRALLRLRSTSDRAIVVLASQQPLSAGKSAAPPSRASTRTHVFMGVPAVSPDFFLRNSAVGFDSFSLTCPHTQRNSPRGHTQLRISNICGAPKPPEIHITASIPNTPRARCDAHILAKIHVEYPNLPRSTRFELAGSRPSGWPRPYCPCRLLCTRNRDQVKAKAQKYRQTNPASNCFQYVRVQFPTNMKTCSSASLTSTKRKHRHTSLLHRSHLSVLLSTRNRNRQIPTSKMNATHRHPSKCNAQALHTLIQCIKQCKPTFLWINLAGGCISSRGHTRRNILYSASSYADGGAPKSPEIMTSGLW